MAGGSKSKMKREKPRRGRGFFTDAAVDCNLLSAVATRTNLVDLAPCGADTFYMGLASHFVNMFILDQALR